MESVKVREDVEVRPRLPDDIEHGVEPVIIIQGDNANELAVVLEPLPVLELWIFTEFLAKQVSKILIDHDSNRRTFSLFI